MINKQDERDKNIKTISNGLKQQEHKEKIIEFLKTNMPELVNADGLLDVKCLQDVIHTHTQL